MTSNGGTADSGTSHGDMIRIEHVKVKDLVDFAQNVISSAGQGQFIPITMQRAIAHSHNPLADGDDVALLAAYQGDEIVGFFGIMPVLLKTQDRFDKVHWFSTWRVTPNLRGKSVGSLLMQEALTLDRDFLIVGSGPARKVCRRFGFWEHPPLVYYQLDLNGMPTLNPGVWLSRLTRRLLRPLKVRVNIDNRFTHLADRALSTITYPIFTKLLQRRLAAGLKGLAFSEVTLVKPETQAQLTQLSPVQLFRGADVVNWMLDYPWVVKPGESPTETMDFYFSDVRQEFKMIALELTDPADGDYKGYIVFQASSVNGRKTLKTLDISLCDPADVKFILPLAFHYARKYGSRQIDLPAEAVENFRSTTLGKLLLNQRKRIYQCKPRSETSPLACAWENIQLQYTDGDMPFS